MSLEKGTGLGAYGIIGPPGAGAIGDTRVFISQSPAKPRGGRSQ
jgi:hypothetical protein